MEWNPPCIQPSDTCMSSCNKTGGEGGHHEEGGARCAERGSCLHADRAAGAVM